MQEESSEDETRCVDREGESGSDSREKQQQEQVVMLGQVLNF